MLERNIWRLVRLGMGDSSWIYGSWILSPENTVWIFGMVMTWSNRQKKTTYQLVTGDRFLYQQNLDTYLDEYPEIKLKLRFLKDSQDVWGNFGAPQPTKPTYQLATKQTNETNGFSELISRCAWIIATKTSQCLGFYRISIGNNKLEWLSKQFGGSWTGSSRGRGNWGTLRIPREDWGTLGKIKGITTLWWYDEFLLMVWNSFLFMLPLNLGKLIQFLTLYFFQNGLKPPS